MNELNPSEHTAAEQRLADQLQRQARSLDIGDTAIATVVRRGRQRRDRRRVVVGVAAVVTLSGTAIATIQLLSKPVSHRVVASNDSVPSDTTIATPAATVPGSVPGSATGQVMATVNRVDSTLVWNVVEPQSSEALGMLTMVGDLPASPPYIAWSTAPGKSNDYVPTEYRSDDGIHWTVMDVSISQQNDMMMFNGIEAHGGRLFAYGTTAANAPGQKTDPGQLILRASDDGTTWTESKLPLDLRALKAKLGGHALNAYGSMASGPHGLLATVNITATLGLESRPDFSAGYKVTADGVVGLGSPCSPTTDVVGSATVVADTAPASTIAYGPDGRPQRQCGPPDTTPPTESALVTWAELGIDPAAASFLNTTKAFLSTDGGTTFVATELPTSLAGQPGYLQQLTATASGFSAVVANETGTSLYRSIDGLGWSEVRLPAGYYLVSFDELPDGSLVALATSQARLGAMASLVSSDGGATWTTYTMDGLLTAADGTTASITLQWPGGSATMNTTKGISALGTITTDGAAEAGGLSMSKDGVTMTLTHSREHYETVFTDTGTGEELGRQTDGIVQGLVRQDQQNGDISVLDGNDAVRVTFTSTDANDLSIQAYRVSNKLVVLNTADGVNWSRDDVSTIVGHDVSMINRAQATDTGLLVTAVDNTRRDAAGIPKTFVLIGTPKS